MKDSHRCTTVPPVHASTPAMQGYDCTIVYCQGKEMLLTDTLSRYAPLMFREFELDVTI